FSDPASFDRLVQRLQRVEREQGTRGNALFYLATHATDFPEIISQLGRVGLDHEVHGGGWRRVIIEKPFGRDLESAIRLNREVLKVFREKQVYRIDHYLGKETVRNLLVFRFGNGIWEPLWNRRYVDHVQITVPESFIATRFQIDDWRWAGVPFYLRTGKRLPKRASEIAIQFNEVPHRLFREATGDPQPNLLAMRIQPDEGILLRFGAKVPGLGI